MRTRLFLARVARQLAAIVMIGCIAGSTLDAVDVARADAGTGFVATGRIAFVRRDGTVNHIYFMDVDPSGAGANLTRLTQDGEAENYPSWSPDGKRLVYARDFNGSAIHVIDADGTGQRRLSPTPGFDVTPSWSPDGKRIVYARLHSAPAPNQPPRTDIRVMNADGTGDHVILANTLFSVEPRWSVNDQVVFMSLMNGANLDVHVMNADGTGLRQLTFGANNGDPVWSPDGTRITFGSDREGGDKLNIFVMNADGSQQTPLTRFEVPIEAGDTNWSADGMNIAFEFDINGKKQSDPNAYAEVWTMHADGSGVTSTGVQCSAVGCAPRWQPKPAAVVEYYNASHDHYFIASLRNEIDGLDTGRFPGWTRTGLAFLAYPQPFAGASPVCRFYIPPGFGDSHFYSASPAECAIAKAKWPFFVLESPQVMYIDLPDIATGACSSGDIPVYRIWNARIDSNHRYTTDPVIRAQMVAKGWVAEGYGSDQVIMCAPKPVPAARNGRIAFSAPAPGGEQIFTIDAQGGSRRQLTTEGSFNGYPSWSKDGATMVFASNRTGSVELWRMRANGEAPTQIATNLPGAKLVPQGSPDGTTIVFAYVDAAIGHPEVWSISADGGNARKLTTTPKAATGPTWSLLPHFSPDGQRIVYASTRSGSSQIWIMNADGSGQTQMTGGLGAEFPDANAPKWSPDGSGIVFWSGFETKYGEIWSMRADGTGARQLTDQPGTISSDNPAWSPDGTKILFDTNRQGSAAIWMMNADGSDQHLLIDIGIGNTQFSWQPLPP